MNNTKEQNEHSYDLIAEDFTNRRKETQVPDFVVEFGELLKKGDTVLDVGCGAGVPNAKYLSEKGVAITGIDISEKLLEEAQKNVPEGRFIKTDVNEFQTDEKFNGIIAWDSLFHLQPDQHEAVLTKLHDLLDEDGYLLFTHGAPEGQITSEMYGQTFTYSSPGAEKLKEILANLGFNILKWNIDKSEGEDKGYLTILVKKTN